MNWYTRLIYLDAIIIHNKTSDFAIFFGFLGILVPLGLVARLCLQ